MNYKDEFSTTNVVNDIALSAQKETKIVVHKLYLGCFI